MTAHQPRRDHEPDIGRRLFTGACAARSGGGDDTLAHLLAALSAPARPDEFAGEEATVQFFRTMHPHLRQPEPGRAVRQTAAGRLMVLKVAAAVVAATATATGAVSVAATNGLLPGPLGGPRDAAPAEHPAVEPVPDTDAGRDAAPSGPAPGESARTLLGLCRTYRSAVTDHSGRPPEDPAFAGLIAAAGGDDKVAAYCDALLNPPTGDGTPGAPTPTGPARPAPTASDRVKATPAPSDPGKTAPSDPATTAPARSASPTARPTDRVDPRPGPSDRTPSRSPHSDDEPNRSPRAALQITPPGSSGIQRTGRRPADPIPGRVTPAPAGRPPGPSTGTLRPGERSRPDPGSGTTSVIE